MVKSELLWFVGVLHILFALLYDDPFLTLVVAGVGLFYVFRAWLTAHEEYKFKCRKLYFEFKNMKLDLDIKKGETMIQGEILKQLREINLNLKPRTKTRRRR